MQSNLGIMPMAGMAGYAPSGASSSSMTQAQLQAAQLQACVT